MRQFVTGDLLLEMVLDEDQDPVTVENADVRIMLPDGTKWSATFVTHDEVGRIMDRQRDSGDGRSGNYLGVRPGLFVLPNAGVQAIVDVVTCLVGSGDFKYEFCRVRET